MLQISAEVVSMLADIGVLPSWNQDSDLGVAGDKHPIYNNTRETASANIAT